MGQVVVPPLARPSAQDLQRIRTAQTQLTQLTPQGKMAYDGQIWLQALTQPGTMAKQPFLRRVFVVLRWGGLVFRSRQSDNHWRQWSDVGWPIATALSHGGRVMIQLPRTRPDQRGEDPGFFNWLFHGLTGTGNLIRRSGTHSTGNRLDQASQLPSQRIKVLEELKGSSFGAGQWLGTSAGQSYGVNLALGGHLSQTATGGLVTDNGDHGHLYIFYRPPTPDKFGGMLIGTEGEAPGHWGASGNFHSWNLGPVDAVMKYRPSKIEGQLGEAFGRSSDAARLQLADVGNADALINGPDRYDSMVIDLTSSHWRYLREVHEAQWDDQMAAQAALPPPALANIPPQRLRGAMEQVLRSPPGPAVGAAALRYLHLPPHALQLRLALFTDEFKARVPRELRTTYNQEFDELVQAIYG